MFTTLANASEDAIPIIAVAGGLLLGMVGIIATFVKNVLNTRAKEQSRREIAAYIAEGSMSADDGARLMEAGTPIWERAKRG